MADRRRLARGGAVFLVLLAQPVLSAALHAQTSPPPSLDDEPRNDEPHDARGLRGDGASDGDADGILVTASILSHQSLGQSSPVSVISQADIVRSGVTTIADALRALAADNAGSISTGFQGGTAAGAAGLSLRGLGVSSTLILIDGQRMVNYPVDDDGVNAFVDMGSIPLNAVDRIEILRDSASSVYGSGAIGGVVNIITKAAAPGITVGGQAGVTQHGDGAMRLANFGAGFGSLERHGVSGYIGGEYENIGPIAGSDRGFPYDTHNLTAIGGLNQNTNVLLLPTNTTTALVARTSQRDLSDPFSGAAALLPTGTQANGTPYYQYTALNLDCPQGIFTIATGSRRGTTCIHDNDREYSQIQPQQVRWALFGRITARLGDDIELNLLGTYSHMTTTISSIPASIRQNQPIGLSPTLSSSTLGGVVLPVYVCPTGIDCATSPDRRLNPNNPYAAAYAGDPANGAARISYLFGDLPKRQRIQNEVFRTSANLHGPIGASADWSLDATLAHDYLLRTYDGVIDIAGLKTAINTGAYNFVDPSQNSASTRALVAPTYQVPASNWLGAVTGRVNATLAQLPGGALRVTGGAEFRRETQHNQGPNADRSRYQLYYVVNGEHSVAAGFVEAALPLLKALQLNLSERFDHYSEGFDRFSPQAGFRFEPIPQVALRGSWSRNFGAPSFSANSADSLLGGLTTVVPPASFQRAHGGLVSAGNTNPYAAQYAAGLAYVGGGLKPESADSLSLGVIVKPIEGLTFDVNYFRIDKSDGAAKGLAYQAAVNAYYAGQPLPSGYAVAALDAPDPLYPDAMRRLLAITVPYASEARLRTAGLDFEVTAKVTLTRGMALNSRLSMTELLYSNAILPDGTVQRFAGTMGPYQLSAGAGTPRLKGTWQTTLSIGGFSATTIAHYVSPLKNVAADISPSLDCSADFDSGNLYPTGYDHFCHIDSFAYVDLNLQYAITPQATLALFVGNLTRAHAPVVPSSYSGQNYLPSWHYAGVIGRLFRVAVKTQF